MMNCSAPQLCDVCPCVLCSPTAVNICQSWKKKQALACHASPAAPTASQALTAMDLSNNQLSGALPALPPALRSLDVSNNSLTGPLPVFGPALEMLSADNNLLGGDVASLNLSTIQYLSLANNSLSGLLTSGLLSSQRLLLLDLSDNVLSGSLPQALALPATMALFLGGNQLTGGWLSTVGTPALQCT